MGSYLRIFILIFFLLYPLISFAEAQLEQGFPVYKKDTFQGVETDRYLIGEMYFDSNRSKWVIKLRISVHGLRKFSELDGEQIKQLLDYKKRVNDHIRQTYGVDYGRQPKLTDFYPSRPRPTSLGHLGVSEVIKDQIAEAVSFYNTEYLDFEVDLNFIDEAASGRVHDWKNRIINDQGEEVRNSLIIGYVPLGQPDALMQFQWTPWVTSEGIAHEIYHSLSNNHLNDGYRYINYPIVSFMNSEFSHLYRKMKGLPCSILPFEFNLLLKEHVGESTLASMGILDLETAGTFISRDITNSDPSFFLRNGFDMQDRNQIARKYQYFTSGQYPGVSTRPGLPQGSFISSTSSLSYNASPISNDQAPVIEPVGVESFFGDVQEEEINWNLGGVRLARTFKMKDYTGIYMSILEINSNYYILSYGQGISTVWMKVDKVQVNRGFMSPTRMEFKDSLDQNYVLQFFNAGENIIFDSDPILQGWTGLTKKSAQNEEVMAIERVFEPIDRILDHGVQLPGRCEQKFM